MLRLTKENICHRDNNNDGDCARCYQEGCPLSVFKKCTLDKAVMTDEEMRAFKRTAERFTYSEDWLGTIKGWRNKEGVVLIEEAFVVKE